VVRFAFQGRVEPIADSIYKGVYGGAQVCSTQVRPRASPALLRRAPIENLFRPAFLCEKTSEVRGFGGAV